MQEVFRAKFSTGWKTGHVFKMHLWSLQPQKWVLALSLPFQRHCVYMQPTILTFPGKPKLCQNSHLHMKLPRLVAVTYTPREDKVSAPEWTFWPRSDTDACCKLAQKVKIKSWEQGAVSFAVPLARVGQKITAHCPTLNHHYRPVAEAGSGSGQ